MFEPINAIEIPIVTKRRILLVLLSTVPTLYFGIYAGMFTSGIGFPDHLGFGFIRALVYSVIPILFAIAFPRDWLFPLLFYSSGFAIGYSIGDALELSFRTLFGSIISSILGIPLGKAHPKSHAELYIFFLLAFSLSGLASLLRLSLFVPSNTEQDAAANP